MELYPCIPFSFLNDKVSPNQCMYIVWKWESKQNRPVKGGDSMAASPVITGNFYDLLLSLTGETVTIFTTSGGDSGAGFTGVILCVGQCFVRLVTQIGPAPGCALGNCCGGVGEYGGYGYGYAGYGGSVRTVGSVTEIPIDKIAAVVSNSA